MPEVRHDKQGVFLPRPRVSRAMRALRQPPPGQRFPQLDSLNYAYKCPFNFAHCVHSLLTSLAVQFSILNTKFHLTMLSLNFHPASRHFLQIPGPSPVPDRLLRAMSYPTIDHRGPEFGALGRQVLKGIRQIFKTQHPVVIYPASGTGAWEAALVNTPAPVTAW
jgi:hypothetical protein